MFEERVVIGKFFFGRLVSLPLSVRRTRSRAARNSGGLVLFIVGEGMAASGSFDSPEKQITCDEGAELVDSPPLGGIIVRSEEERLGDAYLLNHVPRTLTFFPS